MFGVVQGDQGGYSLSLYHWLWSSEGDLFLSLWSSERDNFNSFVCGVCAQSSYVENADAHIDNQGFFLNGNTITGGSNVIIYGASEWCVFMHV